MSFGKESIENLLPSYLTSTEKGRIKEGLRQFKSGNKNFDKNYQGFYHLNPPEYWMQGDLLHTVKIVDWDSDEDDYYSAYSPVIMLSNTCDVSSDNVRSINPKQIIVAPVIPLKEYIDDLKSEGFSKSNIDSFCATLRNQEYSNLLYLPKNEVNQKEYLVFLDKILWVAPSQLVIQNNDIADKRFISLSNFGFYLLLTKISFHFCRIPEEKDR
jgi:hypothetical protein